MNYSKNPFDLVDQITTKQPLTRLELIQISCLGLSKRNLFSLFVSKYGLGYISANTLTNYIMEEVAHLYHLHTDKNGTVGVAECIIGNTYVVSVNDEYVSTVLTSVQDGVLTFSNGFIRDLNQRTDFYFWG